MSPPAADVLPKHAPEDSWSRRLLGPFHVTGAFWYWFHITGIRYVPAVFATPIISGFTLFFFLFLRKIRRGIAANLEFVLGPCGFLERQRRIWRTMRNFAWCLTERYERHGTDRPFRMDIDNMDAWEDLRRRGGGFVLVTAHVGNYEVGSMLPASREARHVHVVREQEIDPRAQAMIREMMARHPDANYSVHFQSEDPLQGIALLQALRAGEIVALQGDRPRAGARNVEATLFGRPFEVAAGPAALARTAGVPILPVFVFREGRLHYRVVFRPAIDPPRTRDRAADIDATARRIVENVEWAIRERPTQWYCFRRVL